jgi:hypothetical protein
VPTPSPAPTPRSQQVQALHVDLERAGVGLWSVPAAQQVCKCVAQHQSAKAIQEEEVVVKNSTQCCMAVMLKCRHEEGKLNLGMVACAGVSQ